MKIRIAVLVTVLNLVLLAMNVWAIDPTRAAVQCIADKLILYPPGQ